MHNSRHSYIKISLLCIIVGLLCLLPSLAVHNGQLVYYGDYFRQYVPFLKETRRMLVSGSPSWSWNTFLGDSFYGAYSYYTAANPFAYIALLFPDSLLLYGTLVSQLVKFAVSGICCFSYIKFFVKNDDYCIIGALLYTFSGFTIINNNYFFFMDVIAVFPLLLLGIEIAWRRRNVDSYLFLVLCTFVNAEINYYFLVSSGIICIIYIIIRFELWESIKEKLKPLLYIILSALLGIGLAGFILLPSFWKMLHTPKASGSIGSFYLRPYSVGNMLERIRIFFMPIENNIQHAFYRCGSWTSTAVYLSVFGCTLALVFFIKNKHHWLTRFTALMFICLMIPILNSIFNLFTDYSYTRWLYAVVITLSLATAVVLSKRDTFSGAYIKKWYFISLIIVAVLSVPPAAVCVMERMGIISPLSNFYNVGSSTIYAGLKGILISFVLTAINYALLALIIWKPSISSRGIIFIVCTACVLNYGGFFGFYNYINHDRLENMQSELSGLTPSDAKSYSFRTDSSASNQNLSLFENTPSVSGYHSLQNENSINFAVAAGYTDNSTTIVLERPEKDSGALDTLLSVKYYTDLGNDPSAAVPEGFSLISDKNGVKTYENDNYLPFGFCYPAYITQDEAEKSNLSKTQLMLMGLVVKDSADVSDLLPKLDDYKFNLSRASRRLKAQSTSSFIGTSDGFHAEISLKSGNYVFFSVPNDAGWTAKVNGKKTDILTVNYGLCAVKCPKGDNTIEFTYRTPYLSEGAALTGICVFIILLIVFRCRKEKK